MFAAAFPLMLRDTLCFPILRRLNQAVGLGVGFEVIEVRLEEVGVCSSKSDAP